MKPFQNRKVTLAISIALLTPTLLWAQKETLGIIEVRAKKALEEKVAQSGNAQEMKQVLGSLNGALNISFQTTGKFTIVSRDNLKALIEEMAVSGNATLTGAKYILDTTVTGFQDTSVTNSGEAGVTFRREIILSGTAEIKKLNGELLASAPFVVTNHIGRTVLPLALTKLLGESNNLLESVPKEAANQIAIYVMSEISSPPEVVDVADKQVTIDWGKGMPIAKGDVWEVCTQKNKTNSSGVVSSIKKPVGKITIERVDKDNSTGVISGENSGIAEGCVLRKP